MKTRFLLVLLIASMLVGICSTPGAAQEQPVDIGWPRLHEQGNRSVVVYQPQVDAWTDNQRLEFKAAIKVLTSADSEPAYGVADVLADTKVDTDSRTVLIDNIRITFRFPNVESRREQELAATAQNILPTDDPLVFSLDRLLAMVKDSHAEQREVEVNVVPPTIFYHNGPAIVVNFIGPPEFKPIQDTSLMAATNTNWDVLLDSSNNAYYLLVGDGWITSTDPLNTSWTATSAPGGVAQLPDDENWSQIKTATPGANVDPVPRVFASSTPSELIVTEGEPTFSPIPGAGLMYVTNSPATLIYFGREDEYYFLVAGRWFRAPALDGPWSAATFDLPDEFLKIPEDHEMGFVLASVQGSEAAEDAVLLASVPRTATVQLDGPTIAPAYDGEPQFEPIESTDVKYAVNTTYQVFQVGAKFYACVDGVWFIADDAKGPWAVCASVPSQIYTIPPTHPTHNVTYVTVYESSPTTVQTSYTSGYEGELVAGGLLLFGAGMVLGAIIADDDHYHYHYPPYWYSYGCGAIYNPRYGGYYRAGGVYGPYGGAGARGYYNPSTGAWSRAAYRYGPSGGRGVAAGYNPYTDTYAARAGGSNVYGSWGRSYVESGDDWARGGYRSDAWGTVAGIETSEGNAAVVGSGVRGRGGVASVDDDLYVGGNGNVYKRDEDGNWSQNSGGGSWDSVDRPQPRAGTTASTTSTGARTGNPRATAVTERPAQTSTRDVGAGFSGTARSTSLDVEYSSRQRANQSAQRYERSRSSSVGSTQRTSATRGRVRR